MSEDSGVVRAGFRRGQLSDEVAGYVRELIMSGNLRPGEFIRQERIADELQLSATPVREGLLLLRGEGFLELKPRRGFVVAPLVGLRRARPVHRAGPDGGRAREPGHGPDRAGRPAGAHAGA